LCKYFRLDNFFPVKKAVLEILLLIFSSTVADKRS
jgi:hypothetical protein